MNPFSAEAKMLRRYMRARNSQAKIEGRPVADFNLVKQEWRKLTPQERADFRRQWAQGETR